MLFVGSSVLEIFRNNLFKIKGYLLLYPDYEFIAL